MKGCCGGGSWPWQGMEGGDAVVVLQPNWRGLEHEGVEGVSRRVMVGAGVLCGGLSMRAVAGGDGGGVAGEVSARTRAGVLGKGLRELRRWW